MGDENLGKKYSQVAIFGTISQLKLKIVFFF